MKKRKNQHKIDTLTLQNPVAKFAYQFNKSHSFCDKSKYRRNAKHKKQEASLMILSIQTIREAFCYLMAWEVNAGYQQSGDVRHKVGCFCG